MVEDSTPKSSVNDGAERVAHNVGKGSSFLFRLRRIMAAEGDAIAGWASPSGKTRLKKLACKFVLVAAVCHFVSHIKNVDQEKNFANQLVEKSAEMVSFSCEQCQDTIKKPKLEAVCLVAW